MIRQIPFNNKGKFELKEQYLWKKNDQPEIKTPYELSGDGVKYVEKEYPDEVKIIKELKAKALKPQVAANDESKAKKSLPSRKGITEKQLHKALKNQQKIGLAGEKFVEALLNKKGKELEEILGFQVISYQEKNNITIKRVSEDDTTLGYDIKVSHNRVELRYIEVKSTTDKNRPFFMTDNEIKVAKGNKDKYFVYRVLVEKVDDTYIGKEIFERLTHDEIKEKYAIKPIAYRFDRIVENKTPNPEVDVKIFDTSLS